MFLEIKDLKVYYEIHGEGKPIVMIHGYYPDHRLMSQCMEPVFEKKSGYKRIYFDLPGMGETNSSDWLKNSDDMLYVVTEVINQLIPGENFIVAGESYGGYLTRGLIYKMPDRIDGFILLCPNIIPMQENREVPEHKILIEDKEFKKTLNGKELEQFNTMAVFQVREVWEKQKVIADGVWKADSEFLEKFHEGGYAYTFEVDQLIECFEKPGLIITGRQDSSVGYRDAWKIIEKYPRASFVVLDLAGHNLQIEQPEIFNVLVKEFLFRVDNYNRV